MVHCLFFWGGGLLFPVDVPLWRYPLGPQYVNFFETISIFLAGDQLVLLIGVSHISSWLQEIQSREWEEREQTNNMLGLIQAQEEELCNIAFPCGYVD